MQRIYAYFKTSAILFALTVQTLTANIVEVSSWEEAARYFPTKEGGLAAFDIDFNITRPIHPATDLQNFRKHGRVLQAMCAEANVSMQDVMFATALTDQQLMDQGAPTLLQQLSSSSSIVGLTARYSGQFAGVNFEQHTLNMLTGFGLSFTTDDSPREVFEGMPEYRANQPTLNNGVLFCNGEMDAPVTKAQVLAEYLRRHASHVTEVVVMDDTRKHLDILKAFFNEHMPDLEFTGIHYTKAMKDTPRECTEADFKAYVQSVIQLLKASD